MASKEYKFEHNLGVDGAIKRCQGLLADLVEKYGLERKDLGKGLYRLFRSGVDTRVTVTDTDVTIVVDLNFMFEMAARNKIEDSLHRKVPPLLKA